MLEGVSMVGRGHLHSHYDCYFLMPHTHTQHVMHSPAWGTWWCKFMSACLQILKHKPSAQECQYPPSSFDKSFMGFCKILFNKASDWENILIYSSNSLHKQPHNEGSSYISIIFCVCWNKHLVILWIQKATAVCSFGIFLFLCVGVFHTL